MITTRYLNSITILKSQFLNQHQLLTMALKELHWEEGLFRHRLKTPWQASNKNLGRFSHKCSHLQAMTCITKLVSQQNWTNLNFTSLKLKENRVQKVYKDSKNCTKLLKNNKKNCTCKSSNISKQEISITSNINSLWMKNLSKKDLMPTSCIKLSNNLNCKTSIVANTWGLKAILIIDLLNMVIIKIICLKNSKTIIITEASIFIKHQTMIMAKNQLRMMFPIEDLNQDTWHLVTKIILPDLLLVMIKEGQVITSPVNMETQRSINFKINLSKF